MAYKKVSKKINSTIYNIQLKNYYLTMLILQMAAERESQNQSQQEPEGKEKKEEQN